MNAQIILMLFLHSIQSQKNQRWLAQSSLHPLVLFQKIDNNPHTLSIYPLENEISCSLLSYIQHEQTATLLICPRGNIWSHIDWECSQQHSAPNPSWVSAPHGSLTAAPSCWCHLLSSFSMGDFIMAPDVVDQVLLPI